MRGLSYSSEFGELPQAPEMQQSVIGNLPNRVQIEALQLVQVCETSQASVRNGRKGEV